MLSKSDLDERRRKMERLALIKERYRKLVLEPKKQIQLEFSEEASEDIEFEFSN